MITVQPEAKKKERAASPVHLKVRSHSRVLVIDCTATGKTLECGGAGVPVGIDYTVLPDGPNISGAVMALECFKAGR